MKRNFMVVGLLALASLAVLVTDASAFFCRGGCCRHRCVTHITCRPYNAFTPICWGNLTCDGCCPNPCAVASGCLPSPYMCGIAPWNPCGSCCSPCAPSCGPSCGPMGCPSGDCMPHGSPSQPMAPQSGPNFTPPPPAPATSYYQGGYGMPGYANYAYGMNPYAMNPYGLMRTNYYPNYYQGYGAYPANYTNNAQPVPYYWYGYLTR